MTYRSIVAARPGGPDVLEIIEYDLREPAPDEVRIRVLAASVCRPDITARRGEALYADTPLGQTFPFVPGYSVIGEIEAVGERVSSLTVASAWVS